MRIDGSILNKEGSSGGEVEIEDVPIRAVEARSKYLIPVFDYLQSPKFQQGRCVEMILHEPLCLCI